MEGTSGTPECAVNHDDSVPWMCILRAMIRSPKRALAAVPGFQFGAVASGIKQSGDLDLGLILADDPVAAAAVFTRNKVKAAPVRIAASRVRNGSAQAVLVNSGNANACTGEVGAAATRKTTRAIANALGIASRDVLPASTGVIGVPLPAEKVIGAVDALRSSLGGRADHFAKAILTTDRGIKVARVEFPRGQKKVRVLAIAKGAGMIHPNMATTLAFVVTDAHIAPALLKSILKESTELTFNRISVDGDTSTNDSIMLLDSGRSGKEVTSRKSPVAREFAKALQDVLKAVALDIVRDGEGAEHVAKICITGASSNSAALKIARTIATSPLVKTALHGCDPNWGRLLAAAGRAGARIDDAKCCVWVGEELLFERGENRMTPSVDRRATKVMKSDEYDIRVDLGLGEGAAHYWTSDLGHAYISVNADYRS